MIIFTLKAYKVDMDSALSSIDLILCVVENKFIINYM